MHGLAEVTLALLLFADAARVDPEDLRHTAGLPTRLLAIGLPMTFALGFGLAAALFTDMPWELAALLGAVLAPTDAALSASIVADESLPMSIRRSLNVESGLNDGIATPVVTEPHRRLGHGDRLRRHRGDRLGSRASPRSST